MFGLDPAVDKFSLCSSRRLGVIEGEVAEHPDALSAATATKEHWMRRTQANSRAKV